MAIKKKTAAKKRSSTAKASHKRTATRTRNDLTKQLRADLKATRETLRAANAAAREELKLAKAAAKAEITVLKDQLNAVMKREKALRKISEEKAKMMWKAGEQWEKKQMAKIKKTFRKAPSA